MSAFAIRAMAAAALACACSGGGSTPADAAAADSGGEASAGNDAFAGTTCSPTGDRLILHGAFEARSTDVVAQPYAGGTAVTSVNGTDDAGRLLMLRRDGDLSDSAFKAPGTFNVSGYPNNVYFVRDHVSGETFKEGFIALAGTLTVTEVRPVLRATFHLEDLRVNTNAEGELGGAPIPGVVDGCVAAP